MRFDQLRCHSRSGHQRRVRDTLGLTQRAKTVRLRLCLGIGSLQKCLDGDGGAECPLPASIRRALGFHSSVL